MKIFVSIKQVPDTDSRVKIHQNGGEIDPSGVKWIISPFDLFAIEEAIKLRDSQPGSQAFVLTVGPKPRSNEALVTALAMGIDEAISVSSARNLDAYSTARAIAEVVKAEGNASLVFMGKSSSDFNQSSVPQMVAQFLGWPHVTVISKFQLQSGSALVERDIEGGAKEVIETKIPCVFSANKGLNNPRYTSLPGIMKAKKKAIKEYELSSLGINEIDEKVDYIRWTLPPEKPAARIIAGEVQQQVSQLVQLLRDESKVL